MKQWLKNETNFKLNHYKWKLFYIIFYLRNHYFKLTSLWYKSFIATRSKKLLLKLPKNSLSASIYDRVISVVASTCWNYVFSIKFLEKIYGLITIVELKIGKKSWIFLFTCNDELCKNFEAVSQYVARIGLHLNSVIFLKCHFM